MPCANIASPNSKSTHVWMWIHGSPKTHPRPRLQDFPSKKTQGNRLAWRQKCRKRTSKDTGRRGRELTRRRRLQKEPMPCRPMPSLLMQLRELGGVDRFSSAGFTLARGASQGQRPWSMLRAMAWQSARRVSKCGTVSSRSENLDFRGFDSSRFLIV